MSLKQPIGQKRLTNVALVRYKKNGKRFEIACYKNKVVNWRTGVEKDIDDVLQTTAVFNNVSKGVLAKHEDLLEVFGTDDEEKICRIILQDGDYQVSDKEREMDYNRVFKDVATILASNCVNPNTKLPYTNSMLEKALKDTHFSVKPDQPAKLQAFKYLPTLSKIIPIERALMQFRIRLPNSGGEDALDGLLASLAEFKAIVEQHGQSAGQEIIVCQIQPGQYRKLHSLVKDVGSIELLALIVTDQGEAQAALDNRQPASQQQHTEPSTVRGRDDGAEEPIPSQTVRSSALTTRQPENGAVSKQDILYATGPISGIPDEFESRRERFQELDKLQQGWTVELVQKRGSSAVDAAFFSPNGEKVGAYAHARRMALQAKQKAGE